jgi:hypothetical protein
MIPADAAVPAAVGHAALRGKRTASAVARWIDITQVASNVAHLLVQAPKRSVAGWLIKTRTHHASLKLLAMKQKMLIWWVIEKNINKPLIHPQPVPLYNICESMSILLCHVLVLLGSNTNKKLLSSSPSRSPPLT